MPAMDALDRYMKHSRGCTECKPATSDDPACVPCGYGRKLWFGVQRENRMADAAAASDPGPGPSCYPLGGLNEYDDEAA